MSRSETPAQWVKACFRCGNPAEQPVEFWGRIAGEHRQHVTLCVDCTELAFENSDAFWAPLRRTPHGA
jgi:hypothetical protein